MVASPKGTLSKPPPQSTSPPRCRGPPEPHCHLGRLLPPNHPLDRLDADIAIKVNHHQVFTAVDNTMTSFSARLTSPSKSIAVRSSPRLTT
ncbi:hypothetical protein BHE74_00044634 [Ensete ventricosum]|nr:hypothetical protein BHE74_00044634 [Ensete ventricosum]